MAYRRQTGRYKPVLDAIEQRAKDVRLWLYRQTANEIVVVSHGAFLHFLTDDWEEGYSEKGQYTYADSPQLFLPGHESSLTRSQQEPAGQTQSTAHMSFSPNPTAKLMVKAVKAKILNSLKQPNHVDDEAELALSRHRRGRKSYMSQRLGHGRSKGT